ncbi:hypothetical protein [Rhizobium sp. BK176]|uniref:hypothetical protein n=1 Tax=Rhizobium sp. BK176 TaxID=2587071 RepID=UPI002167D431|nr:hypothetical protein [Rhizobium sp. BK176]MCS4089178.1 hypothetical protein [Rhizobium sp. BK176]
MPYFLMSDARPRAVAKDLVQIAKELGLKLSTTASQAISSQLFGYESWHDLQTRVGSNEQPGPEDDELTEHQFSARRLSQLHHLRLGGFPDGKIKMVLDRLRPTARAQRGGTARTLVAYPAAERYHPNRVADIWFRIDEHCENFNRDFDYYYSEAVEILGEWARGRGLLFLDRVLCEDAGGATETALESILEDTRKRGWIIDASSLSDLDTAQFCDEILTCVPNDWHHAAIYVHLGRNAFPSPYQDCGVEGVYLGIDIDETDRGCPQAFNVSAMVVCSEPDYPDRWGDGGTARSVGIRMRDNLRNGYTAFYTKGEHDLAGCIEHSLSDKESEEDRQWAPFLSAPIYASMNALGRFFAGSVAVSVAVQSPSSKIQTKISRSVTETQFEAAVANWEGNSFCVRILGTYPEPEACRSEFRSDPQMLVAQDPLGIYVAIDDSFDLHAEDAVRHMRALHDIAAKRKSISPLDHDTWVRTVASLCQAELHNGEYRNATRSSWVLKGVDTPSAKKYLPLVWLVAYLNSGAQEAASVRALLPADKWDGPITRAFEAMEMLGSHDPGNFLENGAHRPFMVQMLESHESDLADRYSYCAEWHYGHYELNDTQIRRNAYLARMRETID